MSTVIIVEDDADLSFIYNYFFTSRGWKVVSIRSGTEAFDRIQSIIYETHLNDAAIMLDLHLPGRSGDEIYEMIEFHGAASRVLICSAYTKEVDAYIRKGARALRKPASYEEMESILKEMLQRKIEIRLV
jgi:DNA-binding response OmpR family regulator